MSVTWRLLAGDVRARLAELPEASVHCVVTSPPYWGLRDYGVAGQLGLEATPNEYVATMVDVFRAVRRVLRDDGTLWLNMGDSYAGARQGPEGERSTLEGTHRNQAAVRAAKRAFTQSRRRDDAEIPRTDMAVPGLKPKDLVGMPWRLAFALQADGWWLRRDIIWAKPNSMPESVTDRPTTAHEYLFLLSKSERYYYDAVAIAEPVSGNAHARGTGVNPKAAAVPTGWDTGLGNHHRRVGRYPGPRTPRPGIDARGGNQGNGTIPNPGQVRAKRSKQNASFSAAVSGLVAERNRRSVWTILTEPYAGAHFATFPRALVAPCVLAGSPVGGTVLDPFAGSGTTLVVATDHQRHAIGIELNPEYVALARARLQAHNPMFAQEATP